MSSSYLPGFANDFSTEALPETLPVGRNSPQKVARGLFAEQLSGTAFTAPRAENLRTWTYRIRPSVLHENSFAKIAGPAGFVGRGYGELDVSPDQLRWDPLATPAGEIDWLDSLWTLAANGDPLEQRGAVVSLYACNRGMTERYFYTADGETLFVPWDGALRIETELGRLEVAPGQIGVVPRGVKFQVLLVGAHARGYVCENFGRPFRLPELGPLGANGLAARRDFETPVAAFEERRGPFELVAKFGGRFFSTQITHSPLDVVAWHGNYAPYRYDLAKFNVIGSISYDHPDPSIFTVLTSPSDQAGTANLDFVVFAPRWLVAEDTFRPPYFHRNVMNELMGLIHGEYDAKTGGGFGPGAASLHNCMSGHGPDGDAFRRATSAELRPQKLEKTLAFMLESRYLWHPTPSARQSPRLQKNYRDCWQTLPVDFPG